VPRAKAICAICGRKIETGYVRESQTRLFYCDTKCIPEYAKLTMIPVKTHAREVS
jgi:ribosomal protein L24E